MHMGLAQKERETLGWVVVGRVRFAKLGMTHLFTELVFFEILSCVYSYGRVLLQLHVDKRHRERTATAASAVGSDGLVPFLR